ncbi:dual specificity phosphatase [Abortiporus biennis]|nr:dual specificity phosphatase [Abortiporus biennis]
MIRFDNLPPEVMQAMCTPMHLILPSSTASSPATHVKHTGSLYLGSFSAILDPSLLSSHKISALVQVLDAPWLPNLDGNPQYAKVECYQLGILDSSSDETREDLKARLEETVLWIDDRLRRGVNVLVHCQQGVSRSAAIVIAYLMYAQNMTYDSAFELVKRKRACVKPNSGFVRSVFSLIIGLIIIPVHVHLSRVLFHHLSISSL